MIEVLNPSPNKLERSNGKWAMKQRVKCVALDPFPHGIVQKIVAYNRKCLPREGNTEREQNHDDIQYYHHHKGN